MDSMKRTIYFLILVTLLFISCQSLSKTIDSKIDFPSRIEAFIEEGYGYQFNFKEVYGYDIISQFGEILNITIEKNSINRDYVSIEFTSIKLHLYQSTVLELYYNNEINIETFKNIGIASINAKENVEYLYGIKIGMTFQEFVNIFGEIGPVNDRSIGHMSFSASYVDTGEPIEEIYLNNSIFMIPSIKKFYPSDKFVAVVFRENKITHITWVF